MIEDDVRRLLQARADAVQPKADALEQIEEKLDAPATTTSRRRAPLIAAAAVLAVVAAIGIALLAQRGDDHASVAASPTTSTTTTPTSTTTGAAMEGVWPGPGDADGVDPAVFDDPVATAQGYVAARVGDLNEAETRVSDFQAGDTNSGEVPFHGALETTVLVRQGHDGRWFVVGAASDLLPVHGGDAGDLRMTAEVDGMLRGVERSATGAEAPIDPTPVTRGAEAWHGTSGSAWRTITTGDGTVGLAEAVVPAPPEPPAVADAMLTPTGSADPRAAAVAYLHDRLAGRNVRVDDFTATDDTHGEVPWEAGVVLVQKLDDGWHVHEAIGDSIQIGGTSLDVGYIGGTLTLAQAGTVHLTVGDATWDVRNDVDREGTSVHFEHAVPTDEPVILRAVFDTDTGYVSVAEKVVG